MRKKVEKQKKNLRKTKNKTETAKQKQCVYGF